jgi:hypothetical protein
MGMALPPRNTPLNAEQRRALALLNNILRGITEGQLALVHRFDRSMIAGLVHKGLATAQREIVTGPGHTTIEVVRVRFSDAGRQAVEGLSERYLAKIQSR